MRLTEIKEKVGSLERQLERDVAKSTGRAGSRNGGSAGRAEVDGSEDADDVRAELEATRMVAHDSMYEDEEHTGLDEITDLGIRVGKMRISDRIGGLNRPRLSEEVCWCHGVEDWICFV